MRPSRVDTREYGRHVESMADSYGGSGPYDADASGQSFERERSGERLVMQLQKPARARWPLVTLVVVALGVLAAIATLLSG